jgi:hypothetical protein
MIIWVNLNRLTILCSPQDNSNHAMINGFFQDFKLLVSSLGFAGSLKNFRAEKTDL